MSIQMRKKNRKREWLESQKNLINKETKTKREEERMAREERCNDFFIFN